MDQHASLYITHPDLAMEQPHTLLPNLTDHPPQTHIHIPPDTDADSSSHSHAHILIYTSQQLPPIIKLPSFTSCWRCFVERIPSIGSFLSCWSHELHTVSKSVASETWRAMCAELWLVWNAFHTLPISHGRLGVVINMLICWCSHWVICVHRYFIHFSYLMFVIFLHRKFIRFSHLMFVIFLLRNFIDSSCLMFASTACVLLYVAAWFDYIKCFCRIPTFNNIICI